MFYTFSQNNSGGHFDFDDMRGITHHVIVEATSLEDAVTRAIDIGLYFNGCDEDIDCPCCGDRWYEPWESDGSEAPTVYGNVLTDGNSDNFSTHWMEKGKEACVHHMNGHMVWY